MKHVQLMVYNGLVIELSVWARETDSLGDLWLTWTESVYDQTRSVLDDDDDINRRQTASAVDRDAIKARPTSAAEFYNHWISP